MTDNLHAENLRLKRAVEELRILNEVSVTISAARSVEEISKSIMRKCVQHFRAEQGAIWLLDQDDKDMQARTHMRVMEEGVMDLPFKVGASLTGWILKNRKPLLVKDLASDQRFAGVVREYASLRSLIAVPLSLRNEIIGFLSLFNSRAEEGFSDEDVRLLSIVAVQSVQTIENARLADEERKLLTLREDLKVARHIQQSLLPGTQPDFADYDIVGLSVAAQAVGGDYYDYIPAAEGLVGLVVADVSGKGTPAALLMANLQACLRSHCAADCSPQAVVSRTNTMFCRFLDPGRFITMVYGVLDLAKNRFTYVNAGHNYPIVVEESGSLRELAGSELVIGVDADAGYSERCVDLIPGDTMLIYTDGVTDARNDHGDMFGEDRLRDVLALNRLFDAKTLSERILAALKEFTVEAPQFDDITMMIIKVNSE